MKETYAFFFPLLTAFFCERVDMIEVVVSNNLLLLFKIKIIYIYYYVINVIPENIVFFNFGV